MIEILSLPIEEPIYVGTCIGVGMVTACVADSIVEKRGRQALI